MLCNIVYLCLGAFLECMDTKALFTVCWFKIHLNRHVKCSLLPILKRCKDVSCASYLLLHCIKLQTVYFQTLCMQGYVVRFGSGVNFGIARR